MLRNSNYVITWLTIWLLTSLTEVLCRDPVSLGVHDDREFWLYNETRSCTWLEASRACDSKNMTLAVLETRDLVDFLRQRLRDRKDIDKPGAWLGARPNTTRTGFMWLDGIAIPDGQGYIHESSNLDGNCLALLNEGFRKISCSTKTDGIICGVNDTVEWMSSKNSTNITWFEARKLCMEGNLDLAVISRTRFRNFSQCQIEQCFIGGYRFPWWWINSQEMTVYDWRTGEEDYPNDSCLSTKADGWVPRQCNNPSPMFICEGRNNSQTTITPILTTDIQVSIEHTSTTDSVNKNSSTKIIIGSLIGGLLVLIIIIVVLVVCLRRAKREGKESLDFHFVASTASSSSRSIETSTIGTQASPHYEYTEAASVRSKPLGVINEGYENVSNIPSYARRLPAADATPYASSSIESVIERGSAVLSESTARPKGSALSVLKKRLSLLMKREYQPKRDALPTAPNTIQRSPDVVPMSSMDPYEDISNLPPPRVPPRPIRSADEYSQVDVSHKRNDLELVENQQYAHI